LTTKRSFDVNVTGPFLMMREAILHMIESGGGSIINIASLAALLSLSHHCAYTSSKSALSPSPRGGPGLRPVQYSRERVCPGFVLSEMTEKWLCNITKNAGADVEALLSKAVRDLPIRNIGKAGDIAGMQLSCKRVFVIYDGDGDSVDGERRSSTPSARE
jgi:NAD(P)-dependent dehydrogenase (short-subunit alcohol dehydrogenase family)